MQLVASPTADPGVASLIPARSHIFVEIDHKYFLESFSCEFMKDYSQLQAN